MKHMYLIDSEAATAETYILLIYVSLFRIEGCRDCVAEKL